MVSRTNDKRVSDLELRISGPVIGDLYVVRFADDGTASAHNVKSSDGYILKIPADRYSKWRTGLPNNALVVEVIRK